MSANVPTDICFSFSGLAQRGGVTGPHTDGWGISFYEGRGCRQFHDPGSSSRSEIGRLVRTYPIKSRIVISHIRRANRGRVCLENTHPFLRELWGRHWSFAHNGQIKGIKREPRRFYHPVGTTDSEAAFCWMLDRLREEFPRQPKRWRRFYGYLHELSRELAGRGIFNFLLSDSIHLYAFCSTELSWLTRRAPFGEARLIDTELAVDFARETTPEDVVTVLATRPLTAHEQWQSMASGELRVLVDGASLYPAAA